MKDFDAYTMTGVTDEDNKEIMKFIRSNSYLMVDDDNCVYDSTGQYIADIVNVEYGLGLLCK